MWGGSMNPGQLNSRITLKHLVKVEDEAGGYEEHYEPYATVWAKVVNKTASKSLEAEEIISIADYEITIRFRKDVLFTDRAYSIDKEFIQLAPSVDVLEKHKYLKLLVRQVVPEANHE